MNSFEQDYIKLPKRLRVDEPSKQVRHELNRWMIATRYMKNVVLYLYNRRYRSKTGENPWLPLETEFLFDPKSLLHRDFVDSSELFHGIPNGILEGAQKDAHQAVKNFFKGLKRRQSGELRKRKVGFPGAVYYCRSISVQRADEFEVIHTPGARFAYVTIKKGRTKGRGKAALTFRVRVHDGHLPEGQPSLLRVKFEKSGKIYASLNYSHPVPYGISNYVDYLGIDVNTGHDGGNALVCYAPFSREEWDKKLYSVRGKYDFIEGSSINGISCTGVRFPSPHVRKYDRKIASRDRLMRRSKKGSKTRARRRVALAKAHEYKSAYVAAYWHPITLCLAQSFNLVFEDLDFASMKSKKAPFSKGFHQTGLGLIRQRAEYKTKLYGTASERVDFEYSSQTCPQCGHHVPKSGGRNSNDFLDCDKCRWCGPRHLAAAIEIRKRGVHAPGDVVRVEHAAQGQLSPEPTKQLRKPAAVSDSFPVCVSPKSLTQEKALFSTG